MDIQIFPLEMLAYETQSDQTAKRYVRGEQLALAHRKIPKGLIFPEHQHLTEQISYVLKGAIKVVLNGKELIVKKGEVIIFPPNTIHHLEALEETLLIEICGVYT